MKPLEPTDKIKTCLDILIDVQMDIQSCFTSPLKPERVLHEVLLLYEITEQQLFRFWYIKVKRVYMFLLYEVCFLDYEKITEIAKCRNELEVIQGIEKIKTSMRKDIKLLTDVARIVERMKTYSEM